MRKSYFGIIMFGFVMFSSLLIGRAFAQTEARAEAQEEALTEAAGKQDSIEITPEAEAAQVVEQNDMYPKRLKQLITVPEKEQEEAKVTSSFDTYGKYYPTTKVHNQPGKVGIIDTGAEYDLDFKLFNKLPIELSLVHTYIGLNNSTEVYLPQHLIGMQFGIETTLPFFWFEKTYFRVALNPSYYTDTWAFRSAAFRMPVQTFAIYQPNEKWTFVLGVATFPDYETPVLPIAGFIYKPNEKWTFDLVPSRPNISYAFNNKWTVYAEGGTNFTSEFLVNKDPQHQHAKLCYDEVHVGGGLKFTLNKYFQASVAAGGSFNRKLQYTDSLGKVSLKNGYYTELRIQAQI
ncbi:MAG: hypothetical protein HY761_05900 [Candidatus Omnitrophica bacterium]|nr:hypothetical protein [Candidatus Omnitrophota bacterium]